MRMIRSLAAIAAIASLTGCATGAGLMTDLGLASGPETAGSSNVQAVWRNDATVSVTGRVSMLSDDPNRCHLLVQSGDDPFALVGRLPGVREGETVHVSGRLAAWSTCDTYRTIRVDSIRRVAAAR
ncbi:MAG: hypothetical protein ACK4QW_16665 [Alphaproteobacteria bacterium]